MSVLPRWRAARPHSQNRRPSTTPAHSAMNSVYACFASPGRTGRLAIAALRRLSGQADHHRRAVRGRRPDRQGRARPRRGDAQAARRADRSSSRTSAAPAARSAPPRSPRPRHDGYTLLLHHIGISTAPALYRNAAVQDARRLRVPRHDQRGADDADRQARRCRPTTTPSSSSGSRPTRARSTSPTPASARPRTCAACCCRARIKVDMQTVPYKGTGAGDDRPARRPGRPDVRPDHQHHAARSRPARSRPIAVTTRKRLTTPALKKLPTLDEAGLKGFNVDDLARPVRAEGHAEGGARQAQRRAARGAEGPRLHQARRGARRGDHHRRARSAAPSTRSSSRPRSPSGGRSSRRPGSTPTELRPGAGRSGAQRDRDRHRARR